MKLTRNIGRRRQTMRLRLGVVLFGIAIAAGVGLSNRAISTALHGVLFTLTFLAVSSMAQGLSGTDVLLAARGLRDLGFGPEKIADPQEAARARASARTVALIAALTSAILTAALVLSSR